MSTPISSVTASTTAHPVDPGLRKAAQQLESVFLQRLLEQMDSVDLGGEDSIFAKTPAEDQFQQLLHGALAERAAGGVGIADLITRQLTRSGGAR